VIGVIEKTDFYTKKDSREGKAVKRVYSTDSNSTRAEDEDAAPLKFFKKK